MSDRLPTDSPPAPQPVASRYRFGRFIADLGAARLIASGTEVALEPKVFRVLIFLIERRQRVVSRRELLDEVWDDVVVTENALTRAIARLRRVLGDDAREPRYIETAHTLGYRFVATVEVLAAERDEVETRDGTAPAAKRRSVARGGLAVAAGLVLLLGVALVWQAGSAGDLTAAEPASGWGMSSVFESGESGESGESAQRPPRLAQITRTRGLDLFPAFSPDGTALAYAAARGNGFELYIRQLQPGGEELQLTADGRDNVEPAWSPDGSLIAYHSRRAGGIWVMPALGGRPRRLSEHGSAPAWSPDGERIVYQSGPLTGFTPGALTAQPSTLWLVGLDGEPPTPLTRLEQAPAGHGSPTFSADGERVVFTSRGESWGGLWSVRIDGSGLVPLVRGAVFDPAVRGAGEVLFAAPDQASPMELFIWRLALDPAGRAPGPAHTGPQPQPLLRARARHLAVSGDGSKLAYSSYERRSNLWTVSLEPATGRAASDPRPLTRDTNERNTGPDFSPDGERIAYLANQVGSRHAIWIMGSDGSGGSELIDSGPLTSAGWPLWLDNGREVAYVAGDWQTRRLRITELESGAARDLIAIEPDWRAVTLSPDARRLAFHSVDDGVVNVFVVEPIRGGSAPRQVTFDSEMAGYPVWSPDSRQLAVELQRGPHMHVAVVDVETGAMRMVIEEPGQSWPGDWSRDGRLLYAGSRNGIWNLYWLDLESGRREQLTRFKSLDTFVRHPVFSPRGDQVVFELGEMESDIWTVALLP